VYAKNSELIMLNVLENVFYAAIRQKLNFVVSIVQAYVVSMQMHAWHDTSSYQTQYCSNLLFIYICIFFVLYFLVRQRSPSNYRYSPAAK